MNTLEIPGSESQDNLKLGSDVDATTGAVSRSHVSSDYCLAEFVATTIGLKYGLPLSEDSEFSVRGELMNQSVNNDGVPAGEETPDLDAVILQLNYSLI
jgi:hypothetical protein